MNKLSTHIQSADWRSEKHVPVLDCPDKVKADEPFEVRITVGKELPHPNTTEHHIRWVSLYFHPEGEKYMSHVAHVDLLAHGDSLDGPNKGAVHTNHTAALSMRTNKPGTLHAMSYCNLHGLWENSREIKFA